MRVSVVIPTFNYARFVGAAVESALTQTRPPDEVLVIDDGSTDDTRAVLDQYAGRIRYVHQPNRGLCPARNAGVRAATGDVIAFLDSDDLFHPRKLEWQVRAMDADPGVDVLGTASVSAEPLQWADVAGPPAVRAVTLDEMMERTGFAPSSMLARKAFCERIGLFDEDPLVGPAEDRGLLVRAAAAGRVARLDAPLTFYRVHPGSMSADPGRMIRAERAVLAKSFRLPALAGRWWLRRRSYAHADFAGGWMALAAGRPGWAAGLAARSLLAYPVPLSRRAVRYRFARVRVLAAALAACAGGRGRPGSQVAPAVAARPPAA